jgi:hypothetical protein
MSVAEPFPTLVPVEPFREWLADRVRVYVRDHQPDMRSHRTGNTLPAGFGAWVGVPDRALWNIWSGRNKRVSFDTVEKALNHEGSTCLHEVYPEFYDCDEEAA